MSSMDYKSAKKFLDSLYDYEKNAHRKSAPPFHLEKIADVLGKLGEPHTKYPVLHIAGTKGKGSVAAMLTAIMRAAKLKTGTYISPHLVDIRERIAIDGEPVSQKLFSAGIDAVRKVLGERPKEYGTFFEVISAAAFHTFALQNIDVALVECGLGGKYDATNIVHPQIAVLTRIGIDHTERLGRTIEEIAQDKAGIIEDGCKVVIGAQEREALETVLAAAKARNAKVFAYGKDFASSVRRADLNETDVQIEIGGETIDVKLPLVGSFQAENAAAAAITAHLFGIDNRTIAAGLENVKLRGRMEIVRKNPLLLIDGAHNPTSAAVTAQEIIKLGLAPATLIVAINSPKDYEKMILNWAKIAKMFIFTTTGSPRTYPPQILAKFAQTASEINAVPIENPDEALKKAEEITGKNGTIFAAGSLYLAGHYIAVFDA